MYYGWRGKVGLVFPHTGSAPEHEYHKYLPEGVTINTTRILFERVDPDGLYEMSQRVVDGEDDPHFLHKQLLPLHSILLNRHGGQRQVDFPSLQRRVQACRRVLPKPHPHIRPLKGKGPDPLQQPVWLPRGKG